MSKPTKFTLRISKNIHHKIRYMAIHNRRSTNKEIETAIIIYIRDFETLHGTIDIEKTPEE